MELPPNRKVAKKKTRRQRQSQVIFFVQVRGMTAFLANCKYQEQDHTTEPARCSGEGNRALLEFLVLTPQHEPGRSELSVYVERRATDHEDSETPKPKLRNLPSEVRYRPKLRNSETETPKFTETNTQGIIYT